MGIPRVLTLEELQSHDGAVLVEYNSGRINYEPRWAFFEYMNNTAVFLRFWRLYNEPGYNKKSYGIVWRCWTERPTSKQMEEEKWNL